MNGKCSFHRLPALLVICLMLPVAALSTMACSSGTDKTKKAILTKDFQVPRASREVYLNVQANTLRDAINLGISLSPKTGLETNQILQDVKEENLDADPNLEQIIVFKMKDDQEDLLRIMVVDFDEARSIWAITWQGTTRATNNKTFTIRVMDIHGASLPEIVCQGTNSKGEQTLDIFHILGTGNFPLQYTSVLSISADIGIDVYSPGGSSASTINENGSAIVTPASGPGQSGIVAQSKDLESLSPLDMVQTKYVWKAGNSPQSPGQYLIGTTTKIPGATVQETALDQLYKSDVAEFEKKYLEGGWVHSYVNQRKKTISQIMFFDTDARTIRLIEGDRMESHEWTSSHKPSYGSNIQVYMINESFHSLKTIGMIQVTGLNSLSFSLQDRDDWKGDFIRLSGDLEEKYFSTNQHVIPINDLVLSGLYRNENNVEVVFDAPRFTWRSGTTTRSGGFLSYQLGGTILELEFIDAKGLIEEKKWYIAKLSELDQGKRQTQKILELQPAELFVGGPQPRSVDPIRLVQAPLDYSR